MTWTLERSPGSTSHVPLDDTNVKANTSNHKAMGYDPMLSPEKQLVQEIKAPVCKSEILDTQEDCLCRTTKCVCPVSIRLKRPSTRLSSDTCQLCPR